MSETEYQKVFSGNFILVQRIISELEQIGITPIIKDEVESHRLAGYGSLDGGYQDIVVHASEIEKAKKIISKIQDDLDLSID